jgi:hypothetical protein
MEENLAGLTLDQLGKTPKFRYRPYLNSGTERRKTMQIDCYGRDRPDTIGENCEI